MVPKEMGSTNQKRLPPDARADCDVFHARLPWKVMVKLIKKILYVSKHELHTQFIAALIK